MSRDRLAKLKTEVLEQALFIQKAQQNNIIHAKKTEYFTCIQRSINPYVSNR